MSHEEPKPQYSLGHAAGRGLSQNFVSHEAQDAFFSMGHAGNCCQQPHNTLAVAYKHIWGAVRTCNTGINSTSTSASSSAQLPSSCPSAMDVPCVGLDFASPHMLLAGLCVRKRHMCMAHVEPPRYSIPTTYRSVLHVHESESSQPAPFHYGHEPCSLLVSCVKIH